MPSKTIDRPADTEYAPHYKGYVSAVPDGDILDLLERQGQETAGLLRTVSEEKSRFRYAPGKWSIREVIGHVCDAERVFAYRALRFARGDATPLASFDENAWGAASNADARPLADHAAEFAALRGATVAMFRGFGGEQLARSGIASGHPITVRALGYIIAGHERHHVKVLKERYGL